MKKLNLWIAVLLLTLSSTALAAGENPKLGVEEAAVAAEAAQAQVLPEQYESAADVPGDDCDSSLVLVPSILDELNLEFASFSGTCGSCSGPCANRSVGAYCNVLSGTGRCYPKFLEDIMCPAGDGYWCGCEVGFPY